MGGGACWQNNQGQNGAKLTDFVPPLSQNSKASDSAVLLLHTVPHRVSVFSNTLTSNGAVLTVLHPPQNVLALGLRGSGHRTWERSSHLELSLRVSSISLFRCAGELLNLCDASSVRQRDIETAGEQVPRGGGWWWPDVSSPTHVGSALPEAQHSTHEVGRSKLERGLEEELVRERANALWESCREWCGELVFRAATEDLGRQELTSSSVDGTWNRSADSLLSFLPSSLRASSHSLSDLERCLQASSSPRRAPLLLLPHISDSPSHINCSVGLR